MVQLNKVIGTTSELSALLILTAVSFAVLSGRSSQVSPGAEDLFEKEIRPILVDRCQSCHGDAKAQGGLRLTSRSLVLKGGGRGPAIVPGKPDQCLLVRAVEYRSDLKMPPTGKISDAEIGRLKRWVAMGAPWPETKKQPIASQNGMFQISDAPRRWWAFQPLKPTTPPVVMAIGNRKSEIGNPIDRFILAELTKHNITPTPRADKRTLIRRATFDLTGLPPTPEQVDAFLADNSPNAFAKVVDRLLESPAHGERMARNWLDVVRYADYHDGNPKARTASCEPLEAWRYRDWVVGAFNRDLPFDQFIVHQIAGDLLPSPDHQEYYADGLIATTFLTNGSWDRGDADKEKMVSDMVDDQVDTVGKAFMGLTLGCARCHNHKFDPISQADYYGLAGIFYSTHILKDIGAKGGEYTLNRIPLAPKAFVEKRDIQIKQLSEINVKLAELDKKSPKPPVNDPGRLALVSQRDKLQKELLPEPPLAEAAQEGGTAGGLFPKIQDVPVHIRGSYTRLGPLVPRHFPSFFAGDAQPPIARGSGRLELAKWIASKDNRLTARVIVNRVWQWHFGSGLVRTPNNFGMLSEPPSHPALLDWLATTFVAKDGIAKESRKLGNQESKSRPFSSLPNFLPSLEAPGCGWSLKRLHRLIMLSDTYQQASGRPPLNTVKRSDSPGASVRNSSFILHPSSFGIQSDPENRWLGRFAVRRLEAEAIRDAMLSVAGTLDATGSGPATDDMRKTCRSLYVQTARWDRGSFAILFDAANPDASEEKRNVSTVAPQALFLLNDDFVLTQAGRLADRLAREVPGDETARIQRAYQLLFARPASAEEVDINRLFLAQARKKNPATAWRDLAHVLLCSNEFVFLD